MRKIILLIAALIVLFYSLLNATASNYELSKLEDEKIRQIGSSIITTINNQGGCDTKLYRNISQEIDTLKKQAPVYSKKREVFILLQSMFSDQWGQCNATVEYDIISNLLSDADNIVDKKGSFKKYIGGGIEARQNSMYTYFYHNDRLINTIKNKINGDKYSVFGKMVEYPDQEDYLNSNFAQNKLNLYSAKFIDNSNTIILFSKYSDNGRRNYIYNSNVNKWTHLNGIYYSQKIEQGTQGIYILGENGKLVLYRNNGTLKYVSSPSHSRISSFILGNNGKITLIYSHDSEVIYISND